MIGIECHRTQIDACRDIFDDDSLTITGEWLMIY
jgi:hypothetical protein